MGSNSVIHIYDQGMSQSKEESKIEPINPSNHLKPDTIWHTGNYLMIVNYLITD